MFIRPSHSRFYLFIYFYIFYRSICDDCVRFLTVIGALQNNVLMMMMWIAVCDGCLVVYLLSLTFVQNLYRSQLKTVNVTSTVRVV